MTKKIVLVVICFCFLPLFSFAGEIDELNKLAKARRDAAEKAYKVWFKRYAASSELEVATTYLLSVRWLNAQLEIATKKEERIAAFNDHVVRLNHWEKIWRDAVGPDSPVFAVIISFQKEAEYLLAKEQALKK